MSELIQYMFRQGVTTYEEIQTKEVPPTYSIADLNVAIAKLEKINKG